MAVAIREMLPRLRRYKTTIERIDANVTLWWPDNPGPQWDGTPCKLWVGEVNGSGYPRMSKRAKHGRRKGKVIKIAVHREVLRELKGIELKKRNKEAMHLCNERRCVNENHLKPGTKSENTLYQVLSGSHNSCQREPGCD
jgi:hypothetical protein